MAGYYNMYNSLDQKIEPIIIKDKKDFHVTFDYGKTVYSSLDGENNTFYSKQESPTFVAGMGKYEAVEGLIAYTPPSTVQWVSQTYKEQKDYISILVDKDYLSKEYGQWEDKKTFPVTILHLNNIGSYQFEDYSFSNFENVYAEDLLKSALTFSKDKKYLKYEIVGLALSPTSKNTKGDWKSSNFMESEWGPQLQERYDRIIKMSGREYEDEKENFVYTQNVLYTNFLLCLSIENTGMDETMQSVFAYLKDETDTRNQIEFLKDRLDKHKVAYSGIDNFPLDWGGKLCYK